MNRRSFFGTVVGALAAAKVAPTLTPTPTVGTTSGTGRFAINAMVQAGDLVTLDKAGRLIKVLPEAKVRPGMGGPILGIARHSANPGELVAIELSPSVSVVYEKPPVL